MRRINFIDWLIRSLSCRYGKSYILGSRYQKKILHNRLREEISRKKKKTFCVKKHQFGQVIIIIISLKYASFYSLNRTIMIGVCVPSSPCWWWLVH